MTNALIWTAAACAALVVAALLWSGARWRRAWGVIAAVLTYVPTFLQVPIHLGMALVVASTPSVGFANRTQRRVLTHPAVLLLGLALAIAIFNLFEVRDNDDLRIGLGRVAGFASVIVLIAALIRSAGDGSAILSTYAQVLVPVAWVQSLSTLLFLLSPAAKYQYLHTPVANLLTGGRSSLLWSSLPDNVLFDDKSGGILFVNANAGSLALGVWACVLFAAGSLNSRRLFYYAGIASLIGAFASGSKTAWILGAALPLAAVLVATLVKTRHRIVWAVFGLLAIPLAAAVAVSIIAAQSTFISASEVSSSARGSLWAAAFELIQKSGATGVGYGRWFDYWAGVAAAYAQPNYLPPHNFLIYLWVELGIIPALCVAATLVISIIAAMASVARGSTSSTPTIWLTVAFFWIILHGMFDTTDFYGVVQTLPAFALAVAWPRLTTRIAPREFSTAVSRVWVGYR